MLKLSEWEDTNIFIPALSSLWLLGIWIQVEVAISRPPRAPAVGLGVARAGVGRGWVGGQLGWPQWPGARLPWKVLEGWQQWIGFSVKSPLFRENTDQPILQVVGINLYKFDKCPYFSSVISSHIPILSKLNTIQNCCHGSPETGKGCRSRKRMPPFASSCFSQEPNGLIAHWVMVGKLGFNGILWWFYGDFMGFNRFYPLNWLMLVSELGSPQWMKFSSTLPYATCDWGGLTHLWFLEWTTKWLFDFLGVGLLL